MSWRTKGQYAGLSEADQHWLREFNRQWDTKAMGRSQTDALEFSSSQPVGMSPVVEPYELTIEISLAEIAGLVTRYTVPRPLKAGWSIHLTLRCGRRLRPRFKDESEAWHAYSVLQELSLIITPC